MAFWRLSTKNRKSAETHTFMSKDDLRIKIVEGFVTGVVSINTEGDSPPEIDLDNPHGTNTYDIANVDEWNLEEFGDGWYSEVFLVEGKLSKAQMKHLVELWEEGNLAGLEDAGWYDEGECEWWMFGPLHLEDEQGRVHVKTNDFMNGFNYFNGQKSNYPQDFERAFKSFSMACDSKNADANAMTWLATMYFNGQGCIQDYELARTWFEKASNAGSAMAANWLASMYDEGAGVSKDPIKSVAFRKIAADRAHPEAQFLLGTYLFNGELMQKNQQEANRYFELAANQDHAGACNWRGFIEHKGVLGTPNIDEAVKYYSKAVSLGFTPAHRGIGVIFFEGVGVKQDLEQVKTHLQAIEEDPVALAILGLMHCEGSGLEHDPIKGEEMIQKASVLRANVLTQLGVYFRDGLGVKPDADKALKFFQRAIALGDESARNGLDKLSKMRKDG